MEAAGLPTRKGGQKSLCTLESHRALLGISISVVGWDWAPSLRQRDTEALPLVGGITVKARSSNQLNLKDISPEYSLEGLMLKLQYFGHLMGRTNSSVLTDAGKG